jgi:FkbM family methyltransferase
MLLWKKSATAPSYEMRACRDIVCALYRHLMLREADDQGLQSHAQYLYKTGDFEGVLRTLLTSEEFQKNGTPFNSRYFPAHNKPFINEHSQFGEINILIQRIVEQATPHQLIVDVGARGIERSNSYDLMSKWGWRGLLFEANPALITQLQQDFNGLNCEIVNTAVSDYNGQAEFHIGINDDVSSLSEENAASWGASRGKVTVNVRRLGDLLAERVIPADFDVLSLDIEGVDIKVLNDLIDNTPYRPRWIIIEASYDFATKSLDDQPFSDAVRRHYTICGQTSANLILFLKPTAS